MRFNKIISLNNCLGLNKIDRFYYEDAPATPPNGAAPVKTDNTANNTSAFDLSKVSDEEFAKVFDDPRLFKHDRFKSLAEAKKERDELKASQSKAEEEKLKANQEFQKLAELKTKEATEANNRATQAEVSAEIVRIAAQKGAVDLNAVKKLIDRGSIKVDENGTITGAEEAVDALTKASPYLFNKGKGAPNIGNGTNPTDGNNGQKRFKLSQLKDARFFRANEKDIMEAYRTGAIENDLGN